eukprot:99487_1
MIPKMHLSSVLIVVLHHILLSHSQIICESNKPCVVNCNNNNSSCSSQTIDASEATTLHLNCESTLCRGIKVLCPIDSTSSCNINCNGANTCSGIGSSAPSIINSTFSSSLNIQCNGEYSCSYMLTYGPILSAYISCNGEYACSSFGAWQFNQDYYLSNTHTIDIICNGTSSCRSSDYYVENSDTVNFFITKAGTHAAENNKIYGSHITSKLSMTCQEYQGCLYLDIYCPDIGTCILNATSATTAYDVDIFINNESNSNIIISGTSSDYTLHCIDNSVTNTILVAYDYDNQEYNFYCAYSSNGCCPDEFKLNTPIICNANNECNINCDGSTLNCRFRTIDASLATSLIVNCNDGTWQNYACQATTIICPSGGDCNVLCSDGASCNYLTITGNYINNMVLQCPESHGCEYSKIYATNMIGDTNIFCTGSSYSCQYSQFDISGNQNNNIYLNCSYGWGACKDINIYASESNVLDVTCDATNGCQNSNIYCPSNTEQACLVKCGDISNSCLDLNILVNDDYINNFLSIDCPLPPINQPQCNTIDFMCLPSNTRTDYIYDSINEIYSCSDDNCCPNNGGRTNSPTLPTTAIPS